MLAIAQVLSGFGLAAGITVGALLAEQLWGSTAVAGVPAVLFTAGAAGASLVIASLSARWGRRVGLAAGYLGGGVGAAGIVLAATAGWATALLAFFLLYGAGSAANAQARFAGADLARPERRASAMALVLMATTAGAVMGPLSADATGSVASGWGLDPLVGPFVLAGSAYLAGALVLAVALRPDPLLTARAEHLARAATALGTEGVHGEVPGWRARVAAGTVVMVVGQTVMIAVMTMTPVHMRHHDHGVGAVGLVIGLHVAAMFVPSPLSGALVDRWGAWRVVALAGAVLGAAGAVAGLADPAGMVGITVGLVLLGLGWSLANIAGSAIVTDAAPLARRASLQGRADALNAIAGAGGAGVSGIVMASTGYGALALASGALAVAVLLAVVATAHRPGRMSPP